MALPYRARLNEQTFLNLPGFHGGAYVYTYVEDTSDRGLLRGPYCEPDCTCGSVENFEPRIVLAIADCDSVINLTFDVDSASYRENSLHKLDTLVAALRVFRAALVEEFEPYERRARELADLKKSPEEDEPPVGGALRVASTHDTVAEKARRAPAKRDTAVRVCPVSSRELPPRRAGVLRASPGPGTFPAQSRDPPVTVSAIVWRQGTGSAPGGGCADGRRAAVAPA